MSSDNQHNVTVVSDKSGIWVVESIGMDGNVCKATFSGLNAEAEAKEYAELLRSWNSVGRDIRAAAQFF